MTKAKPKVDAVPKPAPKAEAAPAVAPKAGSARMSLPKDAAAARKRLADDMATSYKASSLADDALALAAAAEGMPLKVKKSGSSGSGAESANGAANAAASTASNTGAKRKRSSASKTADGDNDLSGGEPARKAKVASKAAAKKSVGTADEEVIITRIRVAPDEADEEEESEEEESDEVLSDVKKKVAAIADVQKMAAIALCPKDSGEKILSNGLKKAQAAVAQKAAAAKKVVEEDEDSDSPSHPPVSKGKGKGKNSPKAAAKKAAADADDSDEEESGDEAPQDTANPKAAAKASNGYVAPKAKAKSAAAKSSDNAAEDEEPAAAAAAAKAKSQKKKSVDGAGSTPAASSQKASKKSAKEEEVEEEEVLANSTLNCERIKDVNEWEHMRHWLLRELAKGKPVVAIGGLLEMGLAGYKQSVSSTKSLAELAKDFIGASILKDGADPALQDWSAKVVDDLPGGGPSRPKSTTKAFLKILRGVYGQLSKSYAEVLDDTSDFPIAAAFHLQDERINIVTGAVLMVCALQRQGFLDEQIKVFYNTWDPVKEFYLVVRISRGIVAKKVMVYGVGYPGSGKSTSFKAALSGAVYKEITRPFPIVVYENGMCMLGAWRDGLNPGTDALEYAVKPKVLEWMRVSAPSFVIAEGCRLMNRAFFNTVWSLGYEIHIVWFNVPVDCAKERYVARGSAWDAKKELFHKGVCTSVDNIYDLVTNTIDATRETAEVAGELKTLIDTKFAELPCVWGDWSKEERDALVASEKPPKPKPAPKAAPDKAAAEAAPAPDKAVAETGAAAEAAPDKPAAEDESD